MLNKNDMMNHAQALLPELEADVASRRTTAYAAARRIIDLL